MTSALALAVLVSHVLAAEPATPSEEAAVRAADAAEKAAVAAQTAADAALKAAEAAKTLAEKAAAAPPTAPAPAAAEEKKPEEKTEGSLWTGTVTLGLISTTGNATSLSFNGAASAERKSESWILALKAGGSYGQAKSTGETEFKTVALAASFQARAAFRFTARYSAYLLGGIDTDHIASIEARPYGEAGLGILWIDEKEGDLSKLVLGTDIGFRYGREFRFQYYTTPLNLDDVNIVAPRFGLAFRYALSKHVIFTEDAEVLPMVVGDSRVLVTSVTKVAARIVGPLAVTVGFQVHYDSRPSADKVSTDTALSVGLEASF